MLTEKDYIINSIGLMQKIPDTIYLGHMRFIVLAQNPISKASSRAQRFVEQYFQKDTPYHSVLIKGHRPLYVIMFSSGTEVQNFERYFFYVSFESEATSNTEEIIKQFDDCANFLINMKIAPLVFALESIKMLNDTIQGIFEALTIQDSNSLNEFTAKILRIHPDLHDVVHNTFTFNYTKSISEYKDFNQFLERIRPKKNKNKWFRLFSK